MGFSVLKKDTILKRNSPLSEDVLAALLIENSYYSPVAYFGNQLRDLLVSNVPLSSRIMQLVYTIDSVLNNDRKDSVRSANEAGPFDTLRMEYTDTLRLKQYHADETRLIEGALRFAHAYRDAFDTTGTTVYYKTYLRNTQTLTAKKLLADKLLTEGDTAAVIALLDTVSLLTVTEDSFETAWYKKYMNVMLALAAYDTSVTDIDSLHRATLYEIAESYASVAPRAHALLALIDTAEYDYTIEEIPYYSYKKDNDDERMAEESVISGRDERLSFNLYPNPNNGRMTLEYEIWDASNSMFELFDVSGKVIRTVELFKGVHSITIEENNLSNGVYLFRIRNDADNIFNGRVIIIK